MSSLDRFNESPLPIIFIHGRKRGDAFFEEAFFDRRPILVRVKQVLDATLLKMAFSDRRSNDLCRDVSGC